MKQSPYAAAITVVLCASFAFAESGAKPTFDALKALQGAWEGKNSQGQTLKVTFRETAGGWPGVLEEIKTFAEK